MEPLISSYGMYSFTFASTDEFDESLEGKRGRYFDWSAGTLYDAGSSVRIALTRFISSHTSRLADGVRSRYAG